MGLVCFTHLVLLTGVGFYDKPNPEIDLTTRVASHFVQPTHSTNIALRLHAAPIGGKGSQGATLAASKADSLSRKTISESSPDKAERIYLNRWQSYVEDYGNRHYPKAVLNSNLAGRLQLLVAIRQDGTLHDVCIHQSSGSQVLDVAAIKIVRSAAPFAPVPKEMLADSHLLEIVRTWEFRSKLSA